MLGGRGTLPLKCTHARAYHVYVCACTCVCVRAARTDTVVKRSTIESFTNHRFLTNEWTRAVDLYGVQQDGNLRVQRKAGSVEVGRLRKNGFCYFESHGARAHAAAADQPKEDHASCEPTLV